MNIPELSVLSTEESNALLEIPAYITLLIGTADDTIDKKEIAMSQKAIAFRTEHGDTVLHSYFEKVDEVFESLLSELSKKIAQISPEDRTLSISKTLADASPILGKLDYIYAHEPY